MPLPTAFVARPPTERTTHLREGCSEALVEIFYSKRGRKLSLKNLERKVTVDNSVYTPVNSV